MIVDLVKTLVKDSSTLKALTPHLAALARLLPKMLSVASKAVVEARAAAGVPATDRLVPLADKVIEHAANLTMEMLQHDAAIVEVLEAAGRAVEALAQSPQLQGRLGEARDQALNGFDKLIASVLDHAMKGQQHPGMANAGRVLRVLLDRFLERAISQ